MTINEKKTYEEKTQMNRKNNPQMKKYFVEEKHTTNEEKV